jgi:hypothetical protein
MAHYRAVIIDPETNESAVKHYSSFQKMRADVIEMEKQGRKVEVSEVPSLEPSRSERAKLRRALASEVQRQTPRRLPTSAPRRTRAPDGWHAESLDLGADVGDADRIGCERTESTHEGRTLDSRGCSSLEHAPSQRLARPAGRTEARGRPDAIGTSVETLADDDDERFPCQPAPRLHAGRQPGDDVDGCGARACWAWPPGPNDREGWSRYLAAGGPEPAILRGAHGIPGRVDRVRALGNAVCPQQAEAVGYLIRELAEAEG